MSFLQYILIKSLEISEIPKKLLKLVFKFALKKKITRMSGNRVLGYPKKLLDTRPSIRDFESRVIWKP
jgi:hypothetical protein